MIIWKKYFGSPNNDPFNNTSGVRGLPVKNALIIWFLRVLFKIELISTYVHFFHPVVFSSSFNDTFMNGGRMRLHGCFLFKSFRTVWTTESSQISAFVIYMSVQVERGRIAFTAIVRTEVTDHQQVFPCN